MICHSVIIESDIQHAREGVRRARRLYYMGLFAVLIMLLLNACQSGGAVTSYEQITSEQARAIMDSEQSYIIVDARTEEEFALGHIEGAILIPEYEISSRAEKELPDKDALILVYCRSGRRSKIASAELVKMGYTNVKEFGGIIDWTCETVKEQG